MMAPMSGSYDAVWAVAEGGVYSVGKHELTNSARGMMGVPSAAQLTGATLNGYTATAEHSGSTVRLSVEGVPGPHFNYAAGDTAKLGYHGKRGCFTVADPPPCSGRAEAEEPCPASASQPGPESLGCWGASLLLAALAAEL